MKTRNSKTTYITKANGERAKVYCSCHEDWCNGKEQHCLSLPESHPRHAEFDVTCKTCGYFRWTRYEVAEFC